MDYKLIIDKQRELIEHLKAYYDAQNSPAVKVIHPQWENYLGQLESELRNIESQPINRDKEQSKESLYIERIKNLQAIIRHCDCPEADNPRFDMVLELTKKDKDFALAINIMG